MMSRVGVREFAVRDRPELDDAIASGGGQPAPVGRKRQRQDGVAGPAPLGAYRSGFFFPQFHRAVVTRGGQPAAIGGIRHGAHRTLVSAQNPE